MAPHYCPGCNRANHVEMRGSRGAKFARFPSGHVHLWIPCRPAGATESEGCSIGGRTILETAMEMASVVAAMFRSGDQVWTWVNPTRPMDCRRGRSLAASLNIVARAAISPQGNTNRGSMGATRSLAAPHRSLAATAQPQHIASFTTKPKGSNSEGNTRRSVAV